MKIFCFILIVCGYLSSLAGCKVSQQQKQKRQMSFEVEKTENEWKQTLTDKEYKVLRKAGTERPFTGKYNMHFEDGAYYCAACDAKLFKSDTKFKSHCGWPSFDQAIDGAVIERKDTTHGMVRTEILCSNCGSHLGHVFNDGPTETGLRYCINSVSLDFEDTPK